MSAASYVGRVGGLAVALGVGAAVVTGYGLPVAWADTPSTEPSSTASSPTESTSTDSSASATAPSSADPAQKAEAPETSEPAASMSTGSTTSQAPPGVVVSTGGAN